MSNQGDGDKRKVSTDALETIGNIIDEREKRDAIHLAVEPVVAQQLLRPGDHVTAEGRLVNPDDAAAVGIVDPFLRTNVTKGQRFWLVVYPRQIHSLRHVWTHPAFADEPEVAGMAPKVHVDKRATSEAWLRNFVQHADCPDYETVIAAAVNNDDGEYLHFDGRDAHGEIPPEFWDHVETVTGRKPPYRATYFSCSC